MKTAATILAALIAFTLGLLSCTPPANSAESTPGVTYAAHVQKVGWQAPVDDGATAAAVHQSRIAGEFKSTLLLIRVMAREALVLK